jgi:hypothetical protein
MTRRQNQDIGQDDRNEKQTGKSLGMSNDMVAITTKLCQEGVDSGPRSSKTRQGRNGIQTVGSPGRFLSIMVLKSPGCLITANAVFQAGYEDALYGGWLGVGEAGIWLPLFIFIYLIYHLSETGCRDCTAA